PPGPLRRYRLTVAGLLVASVVLTAALTLTMLAGLSGFGWGMAVVAVLGVVYLILWAADLVAVYSDPDHERWSA
ncbi:MAG: hypothetical protein R3324_21455, partial [Halobacteriales archaeon]|nr:hypothetical protein [Halobacteriales archaeon]